MGETGAEAKSGTSTTPETQAPQPEAPKTDAEKAKAEAEAKAKAERDKGKEDVNAKTKEALESLSGSLGGDFGILMKKLFESIGKIASAFDGIGERLGDIALAQTPGDIQKEMDKLKNYKIPPIKNVDTITATIEDPKPEEKLVSYLYRCLKVPVPTAEQIAPDKTLDIKHLASQGMCSFQSGKGREEILNGFTNKPEKFFKDDLIFFVNKFNGEMTAGFVQSIGKDTIKYKTIDETGTTCTIEGRKSMCFVALHIPGNKTKGPVPIEKPEDAKKDAKVDQ